jgi:hypothetical protein
MNILILMSSNAQCSICLTDLKKNMKELECKHSFHDKCINEWINKCINTKTCPLCREIIPFKITTLPTITSNIVQINSNNNSTNNIQLINKLKKKLVIIFYSLTVFFFLGSLLSNTISIFTTNNYINDKIRFYNETELNGYNSNTYSGEAFILLDALFVILYIITNIIILNNTRNSCAYLFHFIICVSNAIIHSQFQANTMKYLNDDVLNIYDKKYYDYCVLSIVLYGSSFATNVIIFMFAKIYMIEFERYSH